MRLRWLCLLRPWGEGQHHLVIHTPIYLRASFRFGYYYYILQLCSTHYIVYERPERLSNVGYINKKSVGVRVRVRVRHVVNAL